MKYDIKYNEIIQELRKDKGLTQKELAEIFKTTQRTISNWENGRNEPPYEMLRKYAEYFNVSIDYIMGLTKEPHPAWTIKNNISIKNTGNGNITTGNINQS